MFVSTQLLFCLLAQGILCFSIIYAEMTWSECNSVKVYIYDWGDCPDEEVDERIISQGTMKVTLDECMYRVTGEIMLLKPLKGHWSATVDKVGSDLTRTLEDTCDFLMEGEIAEEDQFWERCFIMYGFGKTEDVCDRPEGPLKREKPYEVDFTVLAEKLRQFHGNHTLRFSARDEEGRVIGCLVAYTGVDAGLGIKLG